jgi:hypothetical protein
MGNEFGSSLYPPFSTRRGGCQPVDFPTSGTPTLKPFHPSPNPFTTLLPNTSILMMDRFSNPSHHQSHHALHD